MDLLTIIFIGIGLSMDALAVSVTSGLTIKQLRFHHALRIAFAFGFFQAFMPLLGWLCGNGLYRYISVVDHWIAFALLTFIGVKMIYESQKIEDSEKEFDPLNIKILLILAVATSIDALAVGLSFGILHSGIITPAITIGIVTFLISLAGVYIGERFGHFFENRIELLGGIILIGIGIKILTGHLAGA